MDCFVDYLSFLLSLISFFLVYILPTVNIPLVHRIDSWLSVERWRLRRPPFHFFLRLTKVLSTLLISELRSGEILPPTQDLKKFDPHRHATFAHIAESTAENGACNLHLPWSKTQKGRGDDVWIPRQEAPLDPIHAAAVHKHFIKNKLEIHHPIAALSYRDSHNNIITLTRSKFVRRINEILNATKKGYPRISGHCFRIGRTTFYLISGVPPDMVKKFGRWRSQAFLEYWRCLVLSISTCFLSKHRHARS